MTPVAELLAAHGAEIHGFVQRHAGGLLQHESPEDLVQGIHLRALERGGEFADRGREPFLAWLHQVARSHLADRRKYWAALRRRPRALLRLTTSGVEPAANATGPSTFAARREAFRIAARALAVLSPRDRSLVEWTAEDVPIEEQAARLGISYDAAKQARLRAVERFSKAFELATRGPR